MERVERLTRQVAELPHEPGVYLWKDAAGEILYVGKAIDLRSRVSSYLDPSTPKNESLLATADAVDFIAVQNEKDALLLEQTLIKRHRPRYNVRLNDDKQYPSIALTDEPYPRLVKVYRRLGAKATHFGPFPDGYGAFHVLQAMNDLLPLRKCKTLPKEKCLYYDIGKCLAPCIKACTDEEYDLLVGEAKDLLGGRSSHLTQRLKADLESAAAQQDFERAARLRDQLAGLEGVLERQHMVSERLEERDVAALAARGDMASAVILHQREGKITGQSPFLLNGLAAASESEALCEFLRSYYQDRLVPRHVTADVEPEAARLLEADLRLMAGHAVTVEVPERGEKRRWVEVAATNATLRLEMEVAALSRRGMGAVEALQRALGLSVPPRTIEGFDVSHRAGEFTRAALVRFVDGEPDRGGYRTFNMKKTGEDAVALRTATVSRGRGREVDDPASLKEALQRRVRGL
ncbi:MAG: excinuclease ABC subunit UvrC, partial [Thermoplasmatota archaeon]